MSMSTIAPVAEKTDKPWYAQLWPWLLILGPLTVVIAGCFTMWLAFRNQDALVVRDYYKEGMAINQDLRRDRVATELGLTVRLRYDVTQGKLRGSVSGRGGVPCTEKLIIRLVHSTLPEKDIALSAQPDARGVFSVGLPMLEMARWQVIVENETRRWRLGGIWAWPREPEAMLVAEAVQRK